MSDFPPPPEFPPPPPPPPPQFPPPPPPPGGYGSPPGYQQYGYGYGLGAQAHYGGFWFRFLAIVIDGFIIGVPFNILGSFMNGGFSLFLLQMVVTLVYVALLEGGSTGQTIGRKVVSLRVVDQETLQPGIGPGRAIGRYFAKLLSGIPLALGYFWMLWDPKKQTWHDKLARTVVIKA